MYPQRTIKVLVRWDFGIGKDQIRKIFIHVHSLTHTQFFAMYLAYLNPIYQIKFKCECKNLNVEMFAKIKHCTHDISTHTHVNTKIQSTKTCDKN